MILWHLGIGAALVYVTLGRRRIDYRYILAGAVLPDGVDAVLGAFYDYSPTARGAAHGLLAVLVVAVGVVLMFKGERRLAVFGLAVGWLTHLVADGMWQAPETFYWPAFGTSFASAPAEAYSWSLFTAPLDHLAQWGGEAIGAVILAWFWVAFSLGRDKRGRRFLQDGYLRP